MYLFNSPPYFVEPLYPKEAKLDQTIPHVSTITLASIVAFLIFCQFGGRIYIYLTSNQQESSNELLSSFTLTISLMFRFGTGLLSKFLDIPDSWKSVSFQFGFMVFTPLVILLNHKSTREYFTRRHPRLMKSVIKIHPTNPQEVQQDVESNLDQEPTFVSIEIEDESFVRARRQQNIPLQTRGIEMPKVEWGMNL